MKILGVFAIVSLNLLKTSIALFFFCFSHFWSFLHFHFFDFFLANFAQILFFLHFSIFLCLCFFHRKGSWGFWYTFKSFTYFLKIFQIWCFFPFSRSPKKNTDTHTTPPPQEQHTHKPRHPKTTHTTTHGKVN